MLAYSKINYIVYEVSLKAQRIPGHIKLHNTQNNDKASQNNSKTNKINVQDDKGI